MVGTIIRYISSKHSVTTTEYHAMHRNNHGRPNSQPARLCANKFPVNQRSKQGRRLVASNLTPRWMWQNGINNNNLRENDHIALRKRIFQKSKTRWNYILMPLLRTFINTVPIVACLLEDNQWASRLLKTEITYIAATQTPTVPPALARSPGHLATDHREVNIKRIAASQRLVLQYKCWQRACWTLHTTQPSMLRLQRSEYRLQSNSNHNSRELNSES